LNAAPEPSYVKSVDGLDIAYQVLGSGTPDILVLAKYFSNHEHLWASPTIADMNRSLARLGRLILLDQRGTGLSDRLRTGRLPTLDAPCTAGCLAHPGR
jgi:pimeloyl-ACP methyl ester carboxylesterase